MWPDTIAQKTQRGCMWQRMKDTPSPKEMKDMWVEAVRLTNLAKYMVDEGDEEKCSVCSAVGPLWKEARPKGVHSTWAQLGR